MEKQNGVTITPYEVEGVPVYYVVPEKPNPAHADHVFIHVHGGGYVFGGGDSCAGEASVIAGRIGIQVLSIDYRMPPEFPFPAAVIDVVTVYKELIEKTPPSKMAIGGTSAGGGLALAFVHQLKSLGLEVPGAIYAGTPWADLTITSDSLFTNEGVDRVLVTPHGMLKSMADLYAGNRNKKNPMISPVYGDFEGFPPTYLITGTRDMLLSDTVRVHRKLRRAGVDADLHVYEGMSHAGYLYVQDSPESREVFEELDAFLQKHLK
jgi:acetyl esterase/lipase